MKQHIITRSSTVSEHAAFASLAAALGAYADSFQRLQRIAEHCSQVGLMDSSMSEASVLSQLDMLQSTSKSLIRGSLAIDESLSKLYRKVLDANG